MCHQFFCRGGGGGGGWGGGRGGGSTNEVEEKTCPKIISQILISSNVAFKYQ